MTAAVAITSLALAVATLMFARNGDVSQPAFRQLTFRRGSLRGARLARDGRTTVYSAAWMGAPQELYVIRPESVQSGAVGIPHAGIFSVSPRGDLAVALGCRLNWGECIGTLAQVPITGGVPREVMKDVQGADWSPDGQSLAVVSFAGGSYRLEYPIGKVLYEPSGWITYARISPNGERIAFLDHARLGDIGGSVAVVDRDGKKVTLSSGWKALQGLAWAGTGNELWFTGSRIGKGGSSALYAVTLAGRERLVFSSPGSLRLHDISSDGESALLTRGTTRGGVVSLASNGTKERDLSWFDYSTVADLSADGKMLLFSEWGEGVAGQPTVFIRGTDGSDAVRLGEGRPLALSPDHQWALAVLDDASTQIALLPTRTGDVRPLPRGPIAEYLDWAAWSPDGRRVYLAARDASDVRRTYVQDIDGGDPRPITPDGFVGLVLSPDGRTMATVDRYGEYYLYPVDGQSSPRPLPGYVDGDVLLQWSADGRFLYVREAGNLTLRLFRLNVSSGAREFWKELVPPDPDGPGGHRLGSGTGASCSRWKELRLYVLDLRRRAVCRARPEVVASVLDLDRSHRVRLMVELGGRAMRRFAVLLAVATSALSPSAVPLHACGDKLLMLGRGIRFQSKHTPRAASVLVYLPESATGQALTDPKLESALREAGHSVRAVTSAADLESALRTGTFDVVLANVTHAPELERAKAVASGAAVVLPAIYLVKSGAQPISKQQSKTDVDKASKDFAVIVEVPGRPGYYCHAVDEAMELKLKREQAATRRP